jgi:hypothetical protein
MLLRRDAKFLDKVTNRQERVFPPGTDWMTFRSQFPAAEVFANSVLDPAIGIGGELGLAAFATADWRNWTSSIKIGLFELSTRVGLPELKDQSLKQGLSLVFNTLDTTANAFANSDNPAEIVPELVTNVGFQVVMQVLQMVGASNPVTFVVTAVIQIATWAVSIATTTIESNLGKQVEKGLQKDIALVGLFHFNYLDTSMIILVNKRLMSGHDEVPRKASRHHTTAVARKEAS